MDKLLSAIASALGSSGWTGLLQLAAYCVEAAAELAQKEGIDPDEFDQRVAELEATRRKDFQNLVDKWRAMLQP